MVPRMKVPVNKSAHRSIPKVAEPEDAEESGVRVTILRHGLRHQYLNA